MPLRLLDQRHRQVMRRADAGAAVGQLARVGLGRGDQLGQRVGRLAGIGDQHQRAPGGEADRREVGHRVVGQVLEQAGVHDQRVDRRHQGQPVGLGARDLLAADIARGAGDVVDDDRLAEPGRQLLRHEAGDDVGTGARREGHDDAHRLVGPGEGGPGARQDAGGEGQEGAAMHGRHSISRLAVRRYNLCVFYLYIESFYNCSRLRAGGIMQARVRTVAFQGIDVVPVDVQVMIAPGNLAFAIVGLADKAVGESRERVRAALARAGAGAAAAAHRGQSLAGRSRQGGQPLRPADRAGAAGRDGRDRRARAWRASSRWASWRSTARCRGCRASCRRRSHARRRARRDLPGGVRRRGGVGRLEPMLDGRRSSPRPRCSP